MKPLRRGCIKAERLLRGGKKKGEEEPPGGGGEQPPGGSGGEQPPGGGGGEQPPGGSGGEQPPGGGGGEQPPGGGVNNKISVIKPLLKTTPQLKQNYLRDMVEFLCVIRRLNRSGYAEAKAQLEAAAGAYEQERNKLVFRKCK